MAHGCRAAMIFCMDYRLERPLGKFLAAEGLDREGVDMVRLAGAVKNLVRPASEEVGRFVLEQIATSRRLHGISQVYLVNHEDCGAYGPEEIPDSSQELQVHRRDLQAARELLGREFPDLEPRAYFMWLDGRVDRIS